MPRPLRLALLLLAAGLLAPAASPAPAAAANGPCIPEYRKGPTCSVWTGKVRSVNDGDTLAADIPKDGLGGVLRVRIVGIQAMEQTSYRASRRRGECHAVDATLRLEQLVRRSKGRIRVASLYPDSRSRQRRLRAVAVRLGGRWRDVGRILLAEGHALWWPVSAENFANERYSVIAQRAAARGKRLYAPDTCGAGPNQGQPIKVDVNWDADGPDSDDVNGEWVRVRNLDPVNPLPLGGWYVRDALLRRYTFPAGAVVPPGGAVTLYAGQGLSGGTEFYWGLRAPTFENVTTDERAMGDGAYLFDPDGDLRAWMIYPCRYGCADPNRGRLQMQVDVRRPELVLVKNDAGWPVDLADYQLKSPPYGYAFPPGTVLNPGESIRVLTRGDASEDTRYVKHWGLDRDILDNGGDVVRLLTYTDVTLACVAWGSRSC